MFFVWLQPDRSSTCCPLYGTDVESVYLKKNPADAVGACTFSLAEATSSG